MSSKSEGLVKIEWRLLNMMAERRIRTVTALRKLLLSHDIEISSQQMGRLVNQFPERLNTQYLRGLLTVLDCDITDLIRVHPADSDYGVEGENQFHAVNDDKENKKNTPRRKKSRPIKTEPPKNILPPGFDD